MNALNPREACLRELDSLAEHKLDQRQRPPRTAYTALAKVYDIVNKSTIGYIGDVSTSGFMLFSGLDLPPNQRRLVSVDLPHPQNGQTTIQLGIRIVWTKPEKNNRQLQAVGCEIMAIEPQARLSLLQSSMAYSHRK